MKGASMDARAGVGNVAFKGSGGLLDFGRSVFGLLPWIRFI